MSLQAECPSLITSTRDTLPAAIPPSKLSNKDVFSSIWVLNWEGKASGQAQVLTGTFGELTIRFQLYYAISILLQLPPQPKGSKELMHKPFKNKRGYSKTVLSSSVPLPGKPIDPTLNKKCCSRPQTPLPIFAFKWIITD